MGIVTGAKFHLYKEKIFSLQLPLSDYDLLNSTFLLEKDVQKKLEVYYTPFDYINENAKVVIAGITPGLHQMKKAYTTVIENRHLSDEELLHQVKKVSKIENPLIIPLGVNVSKVLTYFYNEKPILRGFPHPSGSNGHRHRQFSENKEDMRRQIENYFTVHS